MTFLGKILVVAQVVFSLVFMAFAGAVFQQQETWKKKSDEFKKKYDQKDSEFREIADKADRDASEFKKKTDEAQAEVATWKARSDGFEKDYKSEKKQHEATAIERTNAQTEADIAEREARVRRDETEKELEINKKLHQVQEEHILTIAQLRKQAYDLTRIDKERQEKHNKTLAELAKSNEKLQKYRDMLLKYNTDVSEEAIAERQLPPPSVQGEVLDTKTDSTNGTQFVEISLGGDDGLAAGHLLYVSRGEKYLGQIKLVNVTPDKSVGTVVKAAKNGIIEEGDHVTTKL